VLTLTQCRDPTAGAFRFFPPLPDFTSADSSLVSSPASQDCKTPSPVAVAVELQQTSEGDLLWSLSTSARLTSRATPTLQRVSHLAGIRQPCPLEDQEDRLV
jgi:hypothetical protein